MAGSLFCLLLKKMGGLKNCGKNARKKDFPIEILVYRFAEVGPIFLNLIHTK